MMATVSGNSESLSTPHIPLQKISILPDIGTEFTGTRTIGNAPIGAKNTYTDTYYIQINVPDLGKKNLFYSVINNILLYGRGNLYVDKRNVLVHGLIDN